MFFSELLTFLLYVLDADTIISKHLHRLTQFFFYNEDNKDQI